MALEGQISLEAQEVLKENWAALDVLAALSRPSEVEQFCLANKPAKG